MHMNKTGYIALAVVLLIIIGGVWLAYAGINTTPKTNQMPVTSGENPEPGSTVHDLPVEPAAAAARMDLAGKLGVAEKSIVILNIEERTWTDGCLGLGGPAESCLQALVEGFRVEMLAHGTTYFYRTDATGASLRQEK
jgi:hypothetical protein